MYTKKNPISSDFISLVYIVKLRSKRVDSFDSVISKMFIIPN